MTKIVDLDIIWQKIKKQFNNDEYNVIKSCFDYSISIYGDTLINGIETSDIHNLNVINILLDLNVDYITVSACFFHDILKQSDITVDIIEEKFGPEIAKITESINIINNLNLENTDESSVIYLRKVLVGLASDVRVIFIKLADRLYDMKYIWDLTDQVNKKKVVETEQVLIPIAHRLGINSIKSELEDLCLLFNEPEEYHAIESRLDSTSDELKNLLNDMKESLSDLLNDYGLKHQIKGRVKSIHSIYDKLHNKGKKWGDIYDILALRIFVDTATECYTTVGLIHSKFRPLPYRFKDYIANPKENMYQSLHTTVFGIEGRFFEIQIRTYEMDEIAEKGVASHWSYKEHGTIKAQNYMEQKLEVFRDLIENGLDDDSNNSYINEILNENIYVFTPKGDVVELPKDSTPIDFAYRIHSHVGDTMVGAIVNDEMVPIDYKLQNNDIVTIKTNPNSTPSSDWINIVKTTQAKSKIKAYFNQILKEEYIERGKALLEKECRKNHLVITDLTSGDNLNKILKALKLGELEELYLNIGSLRYTPNYVIGLVDENKPDQYDLLLNKISSYSNRKIINNSPVRVEGIDNIKISLAKCCNPIMGDDIVGFVTLNQGLTVHRTDCKNITNKERLVNVSWNDSNNDFLIDLVIETSRDRDYLVDLINVTSVNNVNVIKFNSDISDTKCLYNLTIKLKNKDELNHLIVSLENKPFIISVRRGD